MVFEVGTKKVWPAIKMVRFKITVSSANAKVLISGILDSVISGPFGDRQNDRIFCFVIFV